MERSQKDLDLFLASIESKLRGPFSSLDLTKTIQTAALRDPWTRHEYLERIQTVLGKTDKITQSRIVVALLGLLDPDGSDNGIRGKREVDDDRDSNDPEGGGALDHDIYSILQQAQEAPTYEEWVRICASLVQGIMYEEVDARGEASEAKDDVGESSTRHSLMGEEARKLLEKTTSEIIKRVIDVERTTEYEEDDPSYVASDKADADPILLAPYRYSLLNPMLLEKVVPDLQSPCVHFGVNTRAEILKLDARLEKSKADEERDHEAKQGTSQLGGAAPKGAAAVTNGTGGKAIQPAAAILPGVRPGGGAKPLSATTTSRPKSSMFMPAKKPSQIVGGGGSGAGKAGKTILHARKAGAAQALLMKGRSAAGGGAAGGKARVAPTNSAAPAQSTGGSSSNGNGGSAAPGGVPRATPGMNRTTMMGKGRAAALLGQRQQQPQQRAAGSGAKSKMMMMDVSEVADLNQQREQQQNNNQPATTQAGGKRKMTSHDDAQSRPSKLSKKGATSALLSSVKSPPAAQHKEATSEPPTTANPPPSADQESGGAGALASAALTAYMAQQQKLQKQPPGGGGQTSQQPPSNGAGGGGGGGAASGATAGGGLDWKDMLRQRSNRLSEDDRRRIQLFFVDQSNPTPNDGESVHRLKLHEERAVDPTTGLPIKETYYLELDYNNFTSRQSKKIKRYKEGQ